jgi:hypothetical protein
MSEDDSDRPSLPSDEQVAQVIDVTGCDEHQARFLLEAAGYDLVLAAQLYQGTRPA